MIRMRFTVQAGVEEPCIIVVPPTHIASFGWCGCWCSMLAGIELLWGLSRVGAEEEIGGFGRLSHSKATDL